MYRVDENYASAFKIKIFISKGYFWHESKLEFIKGISKKVLFFNDVWGTSVFFVHPVCSLRSSVDGLFCNFLAVYSVNSLSLRKALTIFELSGHRSTNK